jgi:hypothetical protein
MHVEDFLECGGAFHDAGGATLADGFVDDEEVGELVGAGDFGEQLSKDCAVLDSLGSTLGSANRLVESRWGR